MKWSLTKVGAVAILSLASPPCLSAQLPDVDLNALVDELQLQTHNPDAVTMAWWIPEEYWVVSMGDDPTMSEEGIEAFLQALRPYTVVGVVDGTIGPFGGVTFVAERVLRDSVRLVDGAGNEYSSLPETAVGPDAKNLLSVLRPMLANMLGPMGQNLHFLVFPALDAEGRRIADARAEGHFAIRIREEEFRWRLPLGALLPPKFCPVDGERLNGAWKFCPWHGVELRRAGGSGAGSD